METDPYRTRQTLIQRACCGDDAHAWNEFVRYYQQFIFILLRHLHVPQQESDDIAQAVQVKLWKNLATFDSEKAKFRTWLITIIRNTTATHMKQLSVRRDRFVLSEELIEMLSDESGTAFEAKVQKEWEDYITALAMNNIQDRFSGQAIEVFRMTLAGTPPQQIADTLGMQLQSIYNLKNRVKARLIKEIKYLRGELEF